MTLLNWAELSRDAVSEVIGRAAVVLPLGALEQHGPHLATGTDFIVARHVVEQAAEKALNPVLVLPALPFGLSHYHARFGATVSIGGKTLTGMLMDIARSVRASGGSRFFVVNGHGGNRGVCTTLSLEMSTADFHVIALSYWDLVSELARSLFTEDKGSIGHAGQAETSILLAVRPDLCEIGKKVPHEDVGPAIGMTAVQRLGTTGVSGDPSAGSADLGKKFIDAVVARLADLFDGAAGIEAGQPA